MAEVLQVYSTPFALLPVAPSGEQNAPGETYSELALGEGVDTSVGVELGVGVELTVGAGVLLTLLTVITILPLLQTSFDPFLTQVNSFPPDTLIWPDVLQLAPAFMAAFAGKPIKTIANPKRIEVNLLINRKPISSYIQQGILDSGY